MAMLAFGLAGAAAGSAIASAAGVAAGATFLGLTAGGWGMLGGQLLGARLMSGGGQDLPTVYGPRLLDNKVQSSAYGKFIPIPYGTVVCAGNVIWSGDIVETQHTETVSTGGGKGGGSGVSQTQVTYSYSVDIAIGLCEGPILGVRKIWANGKLIYSVAEDASSDTFINSQENVLTIYTGSESQGVDSTIEANEGAGNVPAFRGLAYIVLNDFQLAEYGNRIPNFEFEICTAGTATIATTQLAAGSGATDTIYFEYDITHCSYPGNGYVWGNYFGSGANYVSLFDATTGTRVLNLSGTDLGLGAATNYMTLNGVDASGNGYHKYSSGIYKIAQAGTYEYITPSADVGDYGLVVSSDGATIFATDSSGSGNLNKLTSINWAAHTCTRTSSLTLFSRFLRNALAISGKVFGFYGGRIKYADTSTLSGTTWADIGTIDALWGGAVGDDGYVYVAVNNGGTRSVGKYDYAGTLIDSVTIANISTVDLVDSNGIVWAKTSTGTLYGINPDTMTVQFTVSLSTTYEYVLGEGGSGRPLLNKTTGIGLYGRLGTTEEVFRITRTDAEAADIISDIAQRCGLATTDIDVSGVTADVHGYLISNLATGRGNIEPLMSAFFIDSTESDNVVKFVPRGGSSAVTITDDDLAARENDIGAPVDPLVRTRIQEIDLPLEVNVLYIARDNDYQVGQQSSRRLTTSSKQVVTAQLPLVLTDDEAAALADKMMYAGWIARTEFEFTTSREYSKYEPTDLVTITSNGASYLVRITRKDEGANGVIKWAGVLEDTSVYTQSRVGSSGPTPNDVVDTVGSTSYKYLDLPLIRDVDDHAGFYGAASGSGAAWAGARLYISRDSGTTYSATDGGEAVFAATIGTTSNALGTCTTMDDGIGSVTVVLSSGSSLESVTDAQLINGSNYCAIGTHGAWEILQFRTATLTAANTYRLTDLLRGRKGTEWAVGTHNTGDTFILLDSGRMQDILHLLTDRNTQYSYKPVTSGKTLADTSADNFTNTMARLKPLAPVHVGGGRNASSDITIQWIRRSRLYSPFIDYSDAPVGEDSEAYEVDIMNGSTVVRTISVTSWSTDTPSTSYSAADQTTDFGSPQSSLVVKVYQLSATVGRGYVATATI